MMESMNLLATKCYKMSIFMPMMRRNVVQVMSCFCKLSTSASGGDVLVDLDSKTGIALIKWNRKPVNSLSLGFAEQNKSILNSLESNESCRGIVLTSALPNIFCAGFDMSEIVPYASDRERVKNLIKSVTSMMASFRLTDLPVVAAVNGSAIGGGCIVASCFDYRVMISTEGAIGVPEVKLAFPVSHVTNSIFTNLMGHHRAELALVNGTLFLPEEAVQVGLVDELADNEDDLMQKAISKAIEFASVPRYARSIVKSSFVSKKDIEMTDEQIDLTVKFITSDEFLTNIKKMFSRKKES